MVKVRWLHVINGSRILLTFDNGETREVDVKAVLGEAAFDARFPTHAAFVSTQIERAGGIIWDNDFVISGAVLYENAVQRATTM